MSRHSHCPWHNILTHWVSPPTCWGPLLLTVNGTMVGFGFKKLSIVLSLLFFALSHFSWAAWQTFFSQWGFSRLANPIVPQFTWLSQSGQTAYPSASRTGGTLKVVVVYTYCQFLTVFTHGIHYTYYRFSKLRIHFFIQIVCRYNECICDCWYIANSIGSHDTILNKVQIWKEYVDMFAF